MSLDELAREIHATAREKGFWADEHERSFDAQRIALIHSELSECLELLRQLRTVERLAFPLRAEIDEEAAVELADVIIRCLDFAAGRGWSMDQAVRAKMEKNKNRPHLHGKAF